MVDLSVIIVSYNTKKYTLSCVKSIIDDKPKIKKEIIVVDNASKDGTQKGIKKLQRTENSNIILVENIENLGFAKANNQGLNIAKGRFILLLNSDTKVVKGVFQRLYSFSKEAKNAGVVAPKLVNPDGSTQGSIYNFPTIGRAIRQYWFGEKNLFDKYYLSGRKPKTVEAVTMAAFLITPYALKEVGPLNEKYFMYFEDLDYCRRVHQKNLKVYYLPTAKVVHHHGKSGENLASSKSQWKRLIPSSKIYHGLLKHYLINFIIWSGQKWQKLLKK